MKTTKNNSNPIKQIISKSSAVLKKHKNAKIIVFVLVFGVIGTLLLSFSLAQKPERVKNARAQGIRGEVALEKLEGRLPAVAAKYNMAPQRLKELFLNDPTLELTNEDELLYVEPALADHEIKELDEGYDPNEVEGASETISVDKAFDLHSLPESDKTLYLDFDGHTTTEAHWTKYNDGNAIVSAPYDHDGSPSTFSTSEREAIIDIWTAVSEDFAPYHINVTTKDPGTAALVKSSTDDTAYGNRAVISPTKDWYGSAGGVAYINTIGQPKEYVAFVFVCCSLGQTKYSAEATSHELGHSLGLHHDGTTTGTTYYRGHGDWAPIMGSSYYEPVTQWSKGEYNAANNTENDLTLPLKNGLIHRLDEAGNSITGASSVVLSSNPVKRGYIGTTGDLDVYAFNWPGGVATFNVSSASLVKHFSVAGNLDMKVRLLNSSGAVVDQSDPVGAASATVSKDIPAGTYYLEVSGVGYLDPLSTGYSNFASLGSYEITTQTTTTTPTTNLAPSAQVTAQPTNGTAPLNVSFSAAGSKDPEGKPLTYRWDLGNGSSSTSVNPSTTYASIGNYTVRLTVTDSEGLTSEASVNINVTSSSTQIKISSISGVKEAESSKNGRSTADYMSVVVLVTNNSGQPVSNVTVTGEWSGGVSGSGSGVTSGDGKAYIRSKTIRKGGDVTFMVTDLTPNNTIFNYQWDGTQKSVTLLF